MTERTRRIPVNRFIAFLLIMSSVVAFAQTPPLAKSGATIYIEPMDGYETFLAAAFAKKEVPLIVLADKSKADYIIMSTLSHRTPSQPAVVLNNTNVNNGGNDAYNRGMEQAAAARAARGATSASISMIDVHSSQIVFAYSVGKAGNTNQTQSTAEACAKHLKAFIEKPTK
jgi:hypothetical protein